MSSNETQFWFALQVIPRHERTVDRMLEQRGYGHFMPTHRVRRTWSDRTKTIEMPLFPGYVFCKTRMISMEMVRATPGIIRVVAFGGRPYPVSDEEINAISRAVESRRGVGSFPYLQTGTKVQVIAGPLLGIQGIILQIKKRDRLIIAVDLIKQAVSVDIDRSEIAPLPSANHQLTHH